MATTVPEPASARNPDADDLASFGYSQSLHRRLHFFSSFAAAFSYISPATGIFTLFILGVGTLGGAFIWTWPVVVLGQFIVAMNIAEVTLVVITLLNIFGVRVVALINNTGVLFELLGLFVFAIILAAFHNNQGVDVVFHTGGPSFNASSFLVAMFMGLFVIYGFDTASTLSEETRDPRRSAPRAVLGSIAAAFVIGFVFLWAMLMAVPGDLGKVVA